MNKKSSRAGIAVFLIVGGLSVVGIGAGFVQAYRLPGAVVLDWLTTFAYRACPVFHSFLPDRVIASGVLASVSMVLIVALVMWGGPDSANHQMEAKLRQQAQRRKDDHHAGFNS